ncbi:Hypothetical protein CINCED_3A025301 [Cinara cedri]|uniref:Uncharacterized protein n=1 Tax=Cinara cedri TaxID=506608 RepID=A0A5E4M232_9HEMI|nr:Hypothetical protein CINCED_3A025301 [Cinara cedri]
MLFDRRENSVNITGYRVQVLHLLHSATTIKYVRVVRQWQVATDVVVCVPGPGVIFVLDEPAVAAATDVNSCASSSRGSPGTGYFIPTIFAVLYVRKSYGSAAPSTTSPLSVHGFFATLPPS